ncbi:MAG: phosphate/phosphite/phosphonate ABC transporter substrate-binding protein [Chloroflexi bacterium]|nr:phosphate/phosphite/phosphonate ABC transporter substrate-binding protein [Chloroflexota bacterium]
MRFGVETFETAAKLDTQYRPYVAQLASNLGCKVELSITTSYNAEIEAMRAGKLELAEFGPLGYVLAHQVANAQVVATFADQNNKPATYYASIVTWPGSGITDLKGIAGHSFAYSDPASTSGYLFPAYAIRKVANLDPQTGIKPVFAGSHTASYEAIRNHKVDAGELNSDQIASATREGSYKDTDFPTLWKSEPIPQDPTTVRGDLPDAFKQRATAAFMAIDISKLPPDSQSLFNDLGQGSPHLVPQVDSSYDQIRDLVGVLNVDLTKL